MEEDINILESECYYLEELGYLRENNHFIRFNQALGTLIKGYRDSENIMENAVKENLELKKYIRELEEQIDKHVYFETTNPKEIEKNYIPKSKIKEIRDKAEVMDYYTLNNVIDDLTKLLGDEKQWKKYGET